MRLAGCDAHRHSDGTVLDPHKAIPVGGSQRDETREVSYIGDGSNHWSLVHIEDLARLYVAALKAQPGSVYVGVGGVSPTAKDAALALSRSLGLGGDVVSITLEQAREQMGPIADAFALDQQLTSARAQRDLGWIPAHTDPLGVLTGG
jgi:nucleoside-diphosphate-sugar epimerase